MSQPSDRPDGLPGDELMQEAMDAMERLARRLILEYPLVQRWEQPADVVQEAMIRLQRALRDVQIESRLHFFRLAAMQIRRTLIDMARRHSAQSSMAANHGTGDVAREALRRCSAQPFESGLDLCEWTEFHGMIERLPEHHRELFDLLWYAQRSTAEVAELFDVDRRTIQRRWKEAQRYLARTWQT